jgi:hypothetical protein
VLWGHIQNMPPLCFDASNVDPPPPRFGATNINALSLVSVLPRAGGGSLADSQPLPPSSLPPSDDANVAPLSIAGALPGACGVSPADI